MRVQRRQGSNLKTSTAASILIAFSVLMNAASAFAWGATAYRLVSQVASKSLPLEIPEFLRTPEAGRQIAEVSRQPDWSKGAGEPHNSDSDPANFVLVGDDLRIARGPLLSALPPNRASYDAAIRSAGSDQYKAGFLPYALIDGWQQLATDLAYWRADFAGAKWARTPAERSYFLKDQYVREGMTIRDLGYLSHLVANGAQPMNVSVHTNGWGDFPNPQKFSNSKELRARFEGMVVRSQIGDKDITAQMVAYRDCRCSIQRRVSDYLGAHSESDSESLPDREVGRFRRRKRYGPRLRCEAPRGRGFRIAGFNYGRMAS